MAGVKGMRDRLIKSPERIERFRASVRVALIRNRLTKHILGEVEMSSTQVRACEILLNRAIPTVGQVEITGQDGGPIQHAVDGMSTMDKARAIHYAMVKAAEALKKAKQSSEAA